VSQPLATQPDYGPFEYVGEMQLCGQSSDEIFQVREFYREGKEGKVFRLVAEEIPPLVTDLALHRYAPRKALLLESKGELYVEEALGRLQLIGKVVVSPFYHYQVARGSVPPRLRRLLAGKRLVVSLEAKGQGNTVEMDIDWNKGHEIGLVSTERFPARTVFMVLA